MIKRLEKFPLQLFAAFAFILLVSIFSAVALQQYLIISLPVVALVAFLAVADYKKLYLFLIALIPLSIEVEFPGNLTLQFPTEPLMAGFLLILLAIILFNNKALPRAYLHHPVTLLLFVHLIWMVLCLLYSINTTTTLKFIAAKTWFVGSFFFMPLILIRSRSDFKKMVTYLFIPLTIITIIVLVRHAALGFAFDAVNDTVVPFFRNHVNYAALLSVVFPFGFFVRYWYPKGSKQRNWLNFALLVLLAGIYYSYTRAAWIAMLAAFGAYYIVKYKFVKHTILLSLAVALIGVAYLAKDNNYLDYAPDYASTIYHADLDEHLQATVQFKDISSAERVYRWVAAVHMFEDRPWTGVGPANFYPEYQSYTVYSFRTYVSDNPEQSTVHNYFLLMLIEQGLIGLVIFILLIAVTLFTGQRIYHRFKNNFQKQWAMAVVLSFIMVLVHILVSDLIETDKVGSIFFLDMAMIVMLSRKQLKD